MVERDFLERITPGKIDYALWQEHLGRYHFALNFISKKVVLDIACCTGYGTNLLSEKANVVVGVDISRDALMHAIEHYSDSPNVNFVLADAYHIPFRENAFEMAISFETIEHLTDYQNFLIEIKRLLASDGSFIVSTPNGALGSSLQGKPTNPYHVKEFDYSEFISLLSFFSTKMVIYGQCPRTLKSWSLQFLDNHLPSHIKVFLKKLRKKQTKQQIVQAENGNSLESAYCVKKVNHIISGPGFLVANVKNEKKPYVHNQLVD